MKRRRLLAILGSGAVVMLAVLGAGDAVTWTSGAVAARMSFAAPGTKTLSVPATTTFMPTGVTLKSGQSALITAKGTISYNSGNPACSGSGITPNGCAAEKICPVAGGCGALIGRLGSGTPFMVGTRKTVKGPGALSLGINDAPGAFGDNSGAFTVTIRIDAGAFAWPALPSGEVPLATVANGCGPGTVTSDRRWGDMSVYTGRNLVNFRMACNLHDAGYSGAKVKDPLHGNRIVDYFTWSQDRVDDKFLADMREICDDQIRPESPSATQALAECKGRGGTLTFGAVSRYNAVRTVGYWVFLDRPHLRGVWTNEADPTEPALALTQVARAVKGSWRGGKADPESKAEFRGTVISRDTDTIVRGYVKYTDGAGEVSLKTMTITFDPKSPNQIVVAGPGSISGTKVRH